MACFALTGKERFVRHRRTAESVPPHDLHERFDQAAAEIADQVISWRHHLHSHPELSNREIQTSQMIADHLQ